MLARTVPLLVISLFALLTFACSSETGTADSKNANLEKITNESGISVSYTHLTLPTSDLV